MLTSFLPFRCRPTKKMIGYAFYLFMLFFLSITVLLVGLMTDAVTHACMPSPSSEEEKSKEEEELSAEEFLLTTADKFLNKERKRTFQTDHYTVIFDCPNPQAAENIGKAFEHLRDIYASIFGGAFPLKKGERRTHILLFNDETAYHYYSLKIGGSASGVGDGYYISGADFIVSNLRPGNYRTFIAILFHEGVHQLNDHLLYSEKVLPSLWVNEGLAEYFSLTKLDNSGALIFGEIDKGTYETEALLETLQKDLKKKKHIKLADLISCMDKNEFYGDKIHTYYAEAWLFVHFLLHHQDGKYRKSFIEFMRDETQGKGGLEMFKRVFGNDLESLEKEFKDYVLKIKIAD